MPDTSAEPSSGDRLDSWKDIAAYLKREVRTVQLWEKNEGLPVHRHSHLKRGTVYAYRSELDAWWNGRRTALQEQSPTPAPRRWPVALASALGLCLVGAAVWLGIARRPSPTAAEPKVVPLTSDSGSEEGASFSPDGNQVAFGWRREGRQDFDIYVKVVGSEGSLQLTNTPDWDMSPAWSPDGREIAFHRRRADGWCAVYVVSPLGGSERLVAELAEKNCGRGGWQWNRKLSPLQVSWSPDSKWLARPGISLISTGTGEMSKLTFPSSNELDQYPAFSPDGKSLAFARRVRSGVQDLYVLPLAGGKPTRLATQERLIFGLAWTPDGRELIYSSGKWEFGDADLWRVSLSGGPPRRLVEGDRGWLPSISQRGSRLAFTRRSSDTNIWQVRSGNATGQENTALRVIASTQAEGRPAFSPDGQRVAFMSDRSGTLQVWICDRDGSNAKPLTSFPEPGAGMPAWSPDGRQIAFDSSVNGDNNVYVISASGGTPRRLTVENTAEGMSAWSGDGQWVYFSSTRTGRYEIFKIPAQGGGTVQLTKHGGQLPVESPDGRFVYYEKGPSFDHEFEPWRVPVNGGLEERVAESLGTRWALVKDGLYFYAEEQAGDPGGPWILKFFEFATGSKHVVARLEGLPLLGHRPAVSPDRRNFLYAQVDLNETDLMLLADFR